MLESERWIMNRDPEVDGRPTPSPNINGVINGRDIAFWR
jgi:hypothetical protein